MGIVNLANLTTLTRLPLAAALWRTPVSRRRSLALIGAAGVSDLLDGQLARRIGSHPSGAWLDPLCDKIFVLSALGAVSRESGVPARLLVLIALREILQAPIALALVVRSIRRGSLPSYDFRAANIGKLATTAQFLAIGAILFQRRWVRSLAWISGGLGIATAAWYSTRLFDTIPRQHKIPDTPSRRAA